MLAKSLAKDSNQRYIVNQARAYMDEDQRVIKFQFLMPNLDNDAKNRDYGYAHVIVANDSTNNSILTLWHLLMSLQQVDIEQHALTE